ncbi:MAG: ApaG domain [Phycisphaerales bacterium]|jgi:ApaG protein
MSMMPDPILITDVEPGEHGSDVTTPLPLGRGESSLRVRVRPQYLPDRSDADRPLHVFAYAVSIEHVGPAGAPSVRVVDRQWRIIDAHGEEEWVEGEGVVGRKPTLAPGDSFEYASYCPMRTRWGTMEGRLGVIVLDGEHAGQRCQVDVGRFYLVAASD